MEGLVRGNGNISQHVETGEMKKHMDKMNQLTMKFYKILPIILVLIAPVPVSPSPVVPAVVPGQGLPVVAVGVGLPVPGIASFGTIIYG